MSANGKYFDGQSPVSHPVTLSLEDPTSLRIDLNGKTVGRWPVDSIYRDPSHTVAVVIRCGSGDDRVEILDPKIVAGLKIKPRVWKRDDLRSTTHLLIPCFVIFAILVGYGLYNSRVVTKYLASKVTLEQERKLLALIQQDKMDEECKLSDTQSGALDKMVSRLFTADPENRSKVRVAILDIDAVNAYTLPGGEIWIFKPLLQDAKSADELAGVLAHEIEHVQGRHVTESIIRATLFTGLLNALAGDVSGILLIDPSTAAQIFGLKLSREMEQEADTGALARLSAAEISPVGLRDFFERMKKRFSSPKALSFLSTHPADEDRVRLFDGAEKIKTEPSILTDAEWADLKSSCSKTEPPKAN